KVRPPGSHGAAWIFSCLGKAAHWPVPGSTHTGGKGRIGPAPVEPHDLMGSEFNLRCCKAFCELLFSEGSDQGKGRKGLAQHVGQRDLGRRPSFAFRKPFRPVEASPVFGKVVDAPQAAGVIAMARESTGKEAARLRRPGKKRHLALLVPPEIVERDADATRPPGLFGQGEAKLRAAGRKGSQPAGQGVLIGG